MRENKNNLHCHDIGIDSNYNYHDLNILNYKKQPLLTIVLDDMNSVPKVIYKGEEIKGKIEIRYQWVTKGAGLGKHRVCIKRFDEEDLCIKEVRADRLGSEASEENETWITKLLKVLKGL